MISWGGHHPTENFHLLRQNSKGVVVGGGDGVGDGGGDDDGGGSIVGKKCFFSSGILFFDEDNFLILRRRKFPNIEKELRNSASSFHWLSSPIFPCSSVRPSRLVTWSLISTI